MSTQMREAMTVALTRETAHEIHEALRGAPERPKRLYAEEINSLPEPIRSIVLERLEGTVGQCVYLSSIDGGIRVEVRNGPLPRE